MSLQNFGSRLRWIDLFDWLPEHWVSHCIVFSSGSKAYGCDSNSCADIY